MDELTQRVVDNARRRGVVVLTQKQWGSAHPGTYNKRLETHPVSVRKADTLWQHITVTFNIGNLIGDFKKDMQTLERIGDERFGTGVSYNVCADPITGMIGLGANLLARGAHTINDKGVKGFSKNQNYVARAAAWIGMPGFKTTRRARRQLAKFIAAMIEEEALTPEHDYEPHSLVAWKDCPTDEGRRWLGPINRMALEFAKTPAPVAVRQRKDIARMRASIDEFMARKRRPAIKKALANADAVLAKFEYVRR